MSAQAAPMDPAGLVQPELRRIEERALNVMQFAPQVLYDGWLLRLLPGPAKRARSVCAFYRSTLPVVDKIRHCERVYAYRGLPAMFRVTPFDDPPGLDAALEREGYARFDDTDVMLASVGDAAASLQAGEADVRALPIPAYCEAVAAIRGSGEEARALHESRLAGASLPVRGLVVFDAGAPVASGQLAIDDDVAGIFDVVTSPQALRRGHASALCAAMLRWAWTHGLRQLYLQCTASNQPALALYRRFGFVRAYGYHYRCRPGEFS